MLKAAYGLSGTDGIARLQAQAQWLEKPYPSAAASLREGLEETFTINRLDLPPTLRRWRDGAMVLRWFAAEYLETEKHFRRIMGYEFLRVLKAKLQELRELCLECLQSTSTLSVDNTAARGCGKSTT